MENKQTAPKELWIPNYSFENYWANPEKIDRVDDVLIVFDKGHKSLLLLSIKCSKYLSETHVEELLSSKDKEIERLKLEIARLSENNEQLKKQLEQ